MKYRIVKFQDGKDHNDNPKRDRLGVYRDGQSREMQYHDKGIALTMARVLNVQEKDYSVTWEIEEIK